MLVLLIIFIVITPMLSKGISVDMAKTNNPIAMQDADKEDAVAGCCQHGRQGLISEQTRLPPDDLAAARSRIFSPTSWTRPSIVRADARARYERVVEVVDNLRAAGVDNSVC